MKAVAGPKSVAGTKLGTVQPDEIVMLARATTKQRLVYLDNLKIFLTMGIIASHAALIYGPGGGWLSYHEGNPGIVETLILSVPGLLGGLFWLGAFFLIAGMFVPKSLQQKGPRVFCQDRIIRLGIPLIVYILVVMPLTKYAVVRVTGRTSEPLWTGATQQIWPLWAGPLWFVGALLVFSVAYAIYDRLRPTHPRGGATISTRGIILLATVIAVFSFIVRLEWPLYSSQFLGLHLWQWPQYIVLFWAGAWVAERGWPTLSERVWRRCGYSILITAALGTVLLVAVYNGVLPSDAGLYSGGWHWEALFVAAIEGTLAVCSSMWLLEFFRRHVSARLPLGKQLTRSYYAAYVIQAPVVMGLALALRTLNVPTELKFMLVAPLGIVASFTFAYYLVKLPGIGKVL